jgi:hypothetical protein
VLNRSEKEGVAELLGRHHGRRAGVCTRRFPSTGERIQERRWDCHQAKRGFDRISATAGLYFQHLPAGSGKGKTPNKGQNAMPLGHWGQIQKQASDLMKIDAPIAGYCWPGLEKRGPAG